MDNGSRNNDDQAWIFDLSFKVDRLNQNMEKQIRAASWWAVLFRATLSSIGYLLGVLVVAAAIIFVVSKQVDLSGISSSFKSISDTAQSLDLSGISSSLEGLSDTSRALDLSNISSSLGGISGATKLSETPDASSLLKDLSGTAGM